jgi:hypothetical protein
MKKFLGLTMAAVLLVSCSDDDSSSSSVSADKLVGKWYPTTTKIAGLPNQAYENECTTSKDYIQFDANGVGSDVYYDSDCDSYTDAVAYTLAGKKLTINYGGDYTVEATVKSISGSKLVLVEDYDLDEDGTNDATITVTFTK